MTMLRSKEHYNSFLKETEKKFKDIKIYTTMNDFGRIADYIIDNHSEWLNENSLDDYENNLEMIEDNNTPYNVKERCEEKIDDFKYDIAFSLVDPDYTDDFSTMTDGDDIIYFSVVDDGLIVVDEDEISDKFNLVSDFINFLKGKNDKWEINADGDETDDNTIYVTLIYDGYYCSPYFFKKK